MRTIKVTYEDNSVELISGIPDDAKITFASINPASEGHMGRETCIRIYKGARDNGNQLAVIRKVLSFQDTSLTITPAEPKKDWIGA